MRGRSEYTFPSEASSPSTYACIGRSITESNRDRPNPSVYATYRGCLRVDERAVQYDKQTNISDSTEQVRRIVPYCGKRSHAVDIVGISNTTYP